MTLQQTNLQLQWRAVQVQRVFKEHIWSVLKSRSPENEWFPWLFKRGAPRKYWEDNANHGRYAEWLAAELQLVEPEDWYQLTVKMMQQNGGEGLLRNCYNNSPQQFVEQVVKVHLHPDHECTPWQFESGVPRGFWEDSDNHGRYAAWLAAELQLVEPEDWCKLTQKQIYQNGGRGLLTAYYNSSSRLFVEQCDPNGDVTSITLQELERMDWEAIPTNRAIPFTQHDSGT